MAGRGDDEFWLGVFPRSELNAVTYFTQGHNCGVSERETREAHCSGELVRTCTFFAGLR
jgi:hypothetical protein